MWNNERFIIRQILQPSDQPSRETLLLILLQPGSNYYDTCKIQTAIIRLTTLVFMLHTNKYSVIQKCVLIGLSNFTIFYLLNNLGNLNKHTHIYISVSISVSIHLSKSIYLNLSIYIFYFDRHMFMRLYMEPPFCMKYAKEY